MHEYKCYYDGKDYTIHADTSYEAQQKCQAILQAAYRRRRVRGYDITVVLVSLDGENPIKWAPQHIAG